MRLSLFDYELPRERIAQHPVKPRDHSKLLVLDRKRRTKAYKHFFDLPTFLKKGDVLVLNNSFVFPARLIGKKVTGGKIEVFLLNKISANRWNVLLGGKRKNEKMKIAFSHGLKAKVIKRKQNVWEVEFSKSGKQLEKLIDRIGETPLPPYIKQKAAARSYQTLYADPAKRGSVAAPTAGFHFTPQLLKALKKKGVETVFVTLHVGLGTFAPVKVDDITKHHMHEEYVQVSAQAIRSIKKAKEEGRRVIAVGTTSVRVLEATFQKNGFKKPFSGWLNIFIYPGFHFHLVDGIITNFHLPKSTLLMLVSAFAGRPQILRAYHEAIKRKFRFYSFGDAMLLL